jgi:hypothetical protein
VAAVIYIALTLLATGLLTLYGRSVCRAKMDIL